ncbi:PAS domain S-box protein [Lyngbya sp. PCC 8106]|uniref:PAS domain-containing sensor histidine kinase n=1 Tax=Lyngbya sp. (strain PCC 8106) TaxID=313612 RepID=UPI0002F7588B|nr:PAS domain S-box protein [Lyngbya sp. PCC 8106]
MIAHASTLETSNSRKLLQLLRSLSMYSSLIVLITGCVVLIGWALDIDILTSILPERVTMKPNTALGFIVSGTVLGLWHRQQRLSNPKLQRTLTFFINIGSVLIIVLSLFTLIEYSFDLNFHIDELLFPTPPDAVDAVVKGRMAPNTAVNFMLSGSALILLAGRRWYPAQLLSLFMFLIALLGFTGHLYAINPFYSVGSLTGMAIHTAICFMLISLGILFACADQAWMQEVTSSDAGGIMARRLIPLLAILPLIIGLFVLVLYKKFQLTPESIFALRSVLGIVIFVAIVWRNAKTLNRIDSHRQQIQNRLINSERRFRAIFDQTYQFIGLLQPDGILIDANQTALEFGGLTPTDVIGKPLWETHWWHPSTPAQEQLKQAVATAASGEFVRYEVEVKGAGDTVAMIDFSIKPIRDQQGNVSLLIPEGRDITPLKQKEKELQQLNQKLQEVNTLLRRREEEFRALAENIPDTITRHDRAYRYLYTNPACTQQSGIPSTVYRGKTPRELAYREDISQMWETSLETVFQTGQIKIDEFEVINKNEVKTYQALVVPEFAPDSSVQSVLTISRDITQLRQTEHQLRQLNQNLENQVQNRTAELAATNALLREEVHHRQAVQRELFQQKQLLESFFEGSTVGMVILDQQLRFIQLNQALAEMNGVSVEATLGYTINDIFPNLAPQLNPIYQHVLETSEPIFNVEFSGETPKHPGVTRYWQGSYFPLLRQDNQIMAIGAVIVEISEQQAALRERKQAEIALQASEERFRKAVIEAPFPIIIHAEDGKILQISNTITEITGYTAKEIPTIEDWTERVYGERQNVVLEAINQLYRINHRVDEGEFEVQTKDETTRIWNFSSAPLGQIWDHRRLVISMATDITERKQAEVSLANRLRQQALITQLGQVALSGCSLTTLFDQTTQWVAESLGVEYCKVLELLPGGERLLLRSGVGWREGLVGKAIVGTDHDSQAGFTLRVHEPVIVEDLTTESRFSGPSLLQEHRVISGMSTIIEGRDSDQPFGILGIHSTQKHNFNPDDVNFLQAIANLLAEAITRKQTEEEIYELNKTLEQRVQERTQQLQDVNQEMEAFSYSVAHDLRAPLRAIQGFSQVLIEDYGHTLDQLGQEYINRMGASAERLDQLIQDLLAYSRLGRTEIKLQNISLAVVVEAVLNDLKPDIEIKQAQIFIDPSLPIVKAQRNVLKQVLANLLSNAIKFVQPGVLPIVSIKAEKQQVSPVEINTHHSGTRWVRLWIEDNGIGISPQHQKRIFEAFERLHGIESYPGTGIGLAIVKRGVERMGGRFGVQSNQNQGSRFWIELIRAESV